MVAAGTVGPGRVGLGQALVLRILQVAYSLVPVGPDAVGGSEQVLYHLERGLAARGFETLVIASEDSQVSGKLIPLPRASLPYDEPRIAAMRARQANAIRAALSRHRIDLVHMHGFDFDCYLPPAGVPVLATLHCPPAWYSSNALYTSKPGVWLNAVSRYQFEDLSPDDQLLGFVENGVPIEDLGNLHHARRRFALMLARISPEKGIREALEAARSADVPLLIAGSLYPYPDHQRYFTEEIAPLLDRKRRYLGPVDFARKRHLLAAAQCVVIPSIEPETSSLVLREAFAAGTPVIAIRRGALAEVIDHGVTGLLVDSVAEMAAALLTTSALDRDACRKIARERFSLERMIDGYIQLYREVLRRSASQLAEFEIAP